MRYRHQFIIAVVFVFVSGLVTLTACAPVTEAQFHPRVRPEDVVTLKLDSTLVLVDGRKPFTITLAAEIKEGYHIQSSKPLEEYLIPTRVELVSDEFELEEVILPKGELKSFSFSEEKVSVYGGTVRAELTLKAKSETTPGNYSVEIVYHYQACNDRQCLRPTKKQISLTVTLR